MLAVFCNFLGYLDSSNFDILYEKLDLNFALCATCNESMKRKIRIVPPDKYWVVIEGLFYGVSSCLRELFQ